MADQTLTYHTPARGWTSFFSYIPDWIQGMNGDLYTFNEGNLFLHNSETALRNNFYGTQYNSKIKGFINIDPYNTKHFKTISLDSTDTWDCTLVTDLDAGFIDQTWFSEKEGDFYAHIRRNSGNQDLNLLSAQGLGAVDTVTGVSPNDVLNFTFSLDSMISVGDLVYVLSGGVLTLAGTVTGVSGSALSIDSTAGTTPSPADYIVYLKNSVEESYGLKGYYLEFEIENDNTAFVELFSIGSSIFKSYP